MPLPGERRVVEAPVPPAPVQVEQRLAHRLDVIGCDDDACAGFPHELRGGTVEGNDGEDRPFRREVLVDLPGQDAAAAAARRRDQKEQSLGIPLQLERAPSRDVAEQLEAVAEAERLGVRAIRFPEVAREANYEVLETRSGEGLEER